MNIYQKKVLSAYEKALDRESNSWQKERNKIKKKYSSWFKQLFFKSEEQEELMNLYDKHKKRLLKLLIICNDLMQGNYKNTNKLLKLK